MLAKSLMLFVCAGMMIFSNSIFAQSNVFTIEGEVFFKETGDIRITLVNEDIFKVPLAGVKKLVIKIDQNQIKKKKVSFKFEGIQPGIYGIRCFLDVNGNAKLDKGIFGPKEPWGMSWQKGKPAKWPKFEHIAFEVNKNITDIKINIE